MEQGSNEGSRTVLIHVFDEYRKQSKDFVCERDLLLSKMKYFQAYLNHSNENDEIDISVHCDIEVFEWLVQYMHQSELDRHPKITMENIASILVSSEFLQMDSLVDECIQFIAAQMQEFLHLRVDFSCLSEPTLTKLANQCTAEELQKLHDPKDKILSKLQRKKLNDLVAKLHRSGSILCCEHCGLLFMKEHQDNLRCRKGKRSIGLHGELLSPHCARADWSLEGFVHELVAQLRVQWNLAYWYIWSSTQSFLCSNCNEFYNLLEQSHCAFHPGQLKLSPPEARFGCCGVRAFHIDEVLVRGCKLREHIPAVIAQEDAPDNDFGSGRAPRTLSEQVKDCQARVDFITLKSSRESEGLDLREIFEPTPTADEQEVEAALHAHVKRSLSDSSSPRRRRQWRALQLQERDRVRVTQLQRRLLAMRKNLAA